MISSLIFTIALLAGVSLMLVRYLSFTHPLAESQNFFIKLTSILVAGVGVEPTSLAYETKLEPPPVYPTINFYCNEMQMHLMHSVAIKRFELLTSTL